MCGIVGYIGFNQASDFLLDGMAKLEYRGYDSAGIAVIGPENVIKIQKEAGKLLTNEKKNLIYCTQRKIKEI